MIRHFYDRSSHAVRATETRGPVMQSTISLREFCDNRGAALQVDAGRAMIRGVKVLGLTSRNGRAYSPAALVSAAALYEGAKVNVNHAAGDSTAPRDYRDRLGRLREARAAEDGLYADLHFNPKHSLAEQLLWDAEHAPENVGLSHHVRARTATVDGRTVVEQIVQVHSVDLVADPATTRGLFEHTQAEEANVDISTIGWRELRERRPDLVREALAELGLEGGEAGAAARLKEELDLLKTRDRLRSRREEVDRQIAAARLPAEAVTETFVEQLLASDGEGRRRLLDERRRLAESLSRAAPRSVDQYVLDRAAVAPAMDGKGFAELLR